MSFVRPPRQPDIEGMMTALVIDQGGRRGPMLSGFRASHDFGLPGELNDGLHEYPDGGQVALGETGRVFLWLLDPLRQARRLFPGMLFTVQEGARVVANGGITRVLNNALEHPRPVRYALDGHRIDSLETFYDEVSRVIIPGAPWGRNLDAFNDILRGGFGTPDEGFQVLWKHHAASRERLGYPETVRQLEVRLARCHPSNRIGVSRDLERARGRQGPTVFDWLAEIFRDHGPGGTQAADRVELVLE